MGELSKHTVSTIIISPTRELATQTYQVIQKFCAPFSLSSQLFIGGTELMHDMTEYRKTGGNIIVATPGRLEDLLVRHSAISAKDLDFLVLDEADW
jgi:ATP-dependent RNA helicase DDX55/SPB4